VAAVWTLIQKKSELRLAPSIALTQIDWCFRLQLRPSAN